MRLLRSEALTLLLGSVLVLSLGCTRKVETQSLKLVLNSSSSQKAGALSTSGSLEFAVVNVHLPTGIIVKEFEFKDNPIPVGQEISLTIPNVPKDSFLVQFLGVYDYDGQARQFAYGDANAVSSGSDMVADIAATKIGTFTKEGRVVGRYLSQTSPLSGPTGHLIMQFQPPGTKPKMNIHGFPIVDGWFNLMVLDGAPMDYVLASTGEIIFSQVRVFSGSLMMNGASMALNNSLAQFQVPANYRYNNEDIESRPAGDIFIGYFQKSGLGLTLSSTMKVCFANDVKETAPGFFRTSSAGILTNPLEINTQTNATSNDIRWVYGGVGSASSQMYTGTATACTVSSPENKIVVYHSLLSTDEDRLAGISPPFSVVKPFSRWDQYVATQYGNNSFTIKWSLLPGVTSVQGFTVFSKYSVNGDSSKGDRTCENMASFGFSEAGNVLTSASASAYNYNFSNTQLTDSTKYGWRFAICAYRLVDNKREYVGNPIEGGQIGGYEEQMHTGWASSDKAVTGGGSESYESLGGSYGKVSSVASTTSSLYTQLALDTSFVANSNDEVMISVLGMSGTGSCGASNGDQVSPGWFGFARVLQASGNLLKISKGSFVDALDGNTNIANAPSGSSFCYIQVSKVLQFRDLDLSGTAELTVASFGNYVSGGVLPMRVNGALALGSTTIIHAKGKGFAGASASLTYGAGVNKDSNSTTRPDAAGASGSSNDPGGAGGAGKGYGAAASTGSGTASYQGTAGYQLLFGGGGGRGYSGMSYGGNGGGIVFITARTTQVTGSPYVDASGASGTAYTSDGGGGGGGGSVVFWSGLVSGSGNLSVSAKGGDGGKSSAGVGGGGFVSTRACQIGSSVTLSEDVSKGASGNSSGAGNGLSEQSMSSSYVCQAIR